MSDSNVHADTHPSGQPNKTAVNAENPIFGRPADPIPEVSVQQAAVVQSEKNPRETVQSPLINEDVASAALPSAEDLDAVAADTVAEEATSEVETKTYADGSTATGVAPLPDLSPAEQEDAAGKEGEGQEPEEEVAPQDSEPAEAPSEAPPSE